MGLFYTLHNFPVILLYTYVILPKFTLKSKLFLFDKNAIRFLYRQENYLKIYIIRSATTRN